MTVNQDTALDSTADLCVRPTLVDQNALTPQQRSVHDSIAGGRRGHVAPPFLYLLHSPQTTEHVQSLGVHLRYNNALGRRLSELATLVTARVWNADYEWAVHEQDARAAGLEEAIIAAIRAGHAPETADRKAVLVYRVAHTVHTIRNLSDSLIAEAVGELGEAAFADLVCLLGYYGLVSMALNIYRVPAPEGLQGLAGTSSD